MAFGGVDISVWSVGVQHRPRWNKTVIHPIKRKVEHSGGRPLHLAKLYDISVCLFLSVLPPDGSTLTVYLLYMVINLLPFPSLSVPV